MSYFPLFIELKDADCLVVGGGKVALRKVEVLLDFGAKVTVVAPKISQEIRDLQKNSSVVLQQRMFEARDVEGRILVVAATKDGALNRQISLLCRKKKVPINAVDQKADCTFIFPSYVKNGEVTAAVTSGGLSPVLTQHLKRKIEEVMPEHTGELARVLGDIRPILKKELATEAQKKAVYEKLLDIGWQQEGSFTEEDVRRSIDEVRSGEMKADGV